jgi:hypothetical protein
MLRTTCHGANEPVRLRVLSAKLAIGNLDLAGERGDTTLLPQHDRYRSRAIARPRWTCSALKSFSSERRLRIAGDTPLTSCLLHPCIALYSVALNSFAIKHEHAEIQRACCVTTSSGFFKPLCCGVLVG